MTGIDEDARITRRSQLLTNDLSEEAAVMLDVERGEYFGVQEVGKAVWEQLEQPTTLAEICATLEEQYEVDGATCRREVEAFLAELRDEGLIDVEDAPRAP